MISDYTPSNSKTEKNASFWAFCVLFCIFWMRRTVIGFVVFVLKRLPLIGMIGDYILPMFTVFLLLLALPYILKNTHPFDLVFYLFCAMVICVSVLLWQKNADYIVQQLWQILGLSLPVYFLGICYSHDDMKDLLYTCSWISVVVMSAYQLYLLNTSELMEYDMHTSYNCLPSVLYLVNWAFNTKKVKHWLLGALGIGLIFVFGTRGPVAAILLFTVFRLVWGSWGAAGKTVRFIFAAAFILIGYLVVATDTATGVIAAISGFFERIGFSTRIFDMYLQGNVADTTGREDLVAEVMQAVLESPMIGLGIMGDRAILAGSYVHNILLELWCDFGLVLGTVLFFLVLQQPIMAIYRNPSQENQYFVLMLSTMVLTKLMFSSSYIIEPFFFLMLGVAIAEKRRIRQMSDLDEETNQQEAAVAQEM